MTWTETVSRVQGLQDKARPCSSSQKCTLPKKHQGWRMMKGGCIKYGLIWCRESRKCGVRKEREGFEWNEWTREQPATCTRCNRGSGAKRAPSGITRKVRKWVKNSSNPRARRPRAAHGKGVAVRDASSPWERSRSQECNDSNV